MEASAFRTSRIALIVLGMHRSGTSALARVLSFLGCALPSQEFYANEANPTGYWESLRANHLNDELFGQFGMAWDSIRSLPDDWLSQAQDQGFRDRALTVLHEDFGEAPTAVLKDPRLCRLLPLWRLALNDAGFVPKVVIPIRHPVEVAASLGRRNVFGIERAELLWLVHVLDAEAATRDLPRVFITYRELLADWQATAERIGANLDLLWPLPIAEAAPSIASFLSSTLRHYQSDDECTDASIAVWVRDVYHALLALVQDPHDSGAQAVLDDVSRRCRDGLALFGPAIDFAERDAHLEVAKLEQKLEQARVGQLGAARDAEHEKRRLIGDIAGLRDVNTCLSEDKIRLTAENTRLMESGRVAMRAWLTYRSQSFEKSPSATRIGSLAKGGAGVVAVARSVAVSRGKVPARLLRQGIQVLAGGLFDRGYYLERNPDVAALGSDPLVHWLVHGWQEGRNPHPCFDVNWYLAQRPDVRRANMNPVIHYLCHGVAEGISPHPAFSPRYYLESNPDVVASGTDPLVHYVSYGRYEGRNPHPEIDVAQYLLDHPDAISEGLDPLAHGEWSQRVRVPSDRRADVWESPLPAMGAIHLRVSVVVPNFNYARHLVERLGSIFAQTFPLFEVIVLDDASTDDSLAVLELWRVESGHDFRVIPNGVNSGSVFRQWAKAAELAQGDLIWIAEADDRAHPDFLRRIVPCFQESDVNLAYAQSRQIDGEGRILANDYLDYVRDIDADKWSRSWLRDARSELAQGMLVKNAIPNVSAVVFRREVFADVLFTHLDEIAGYRHAGDWLVYALLLARGGKVGFVAESLNDHRRHGGSVTLGGYGRGLLYEISKMQRRVFDLVNSFGVVSPPLRAGAYLQELYEQFGLVRDDFPTWRDDPDLKEAADSSLYQTKGNDASRGQPANTPAPLNRVGGSPSRAGLGRAKHRLRVIWQRLPLDGRMRQTLEHRAYRLLPTAFVGMPGYERWRAERGGGPKAEIPGGDAESGSAWRPGAVIHQPKSVPLWEGEAVRDPAVRLIAFYLPQFHPIPENDRWWGQGFTEWSNVLRGEPQFSGHRQPMLPGDLGFYDLRSPRVQHRQVELAKRYGLGGFCFYFYWFAGKRLLESPVLAYLQDSSLDLPFCLCWANENWSRRWDGLESEVLIGQSHSAEDDLAFIAYVSRYLRDDRYIRVGGRPLLIVYRPDLLPEPRATAERWRDWCRTHGIGELHLATTQSFSLCDPAEFGFDAAIEFPPNNTAPPEITSQVPGLSPGFSGRIYDWGVFPVRSRAYADPGYRIYRGVNPCWDNTARRQDRAGIFLGAHPDGFGEWLVNAARDTMSRFAALDERLVFINAWNEWAEGAVLEPTRDHGYAYLQAVRDALISLREPSIALVTHDAYIHGAQLLALHMAECLRERLGYRVELVALGPGPLLQEFARFGRVHHLDGKSQDGAEARSLAGYLKRLGVSSAIVNTSASGAFCSALADAGIRCVALVHELPDLIARHQLAPHAHALAAHAERVVFPAAFVRDGFARVAKVPTERIVVRPQGLYKRNALASPQGREQARRQLRDRLGLSAEMRIVLGVGFGDRRKGLDLFVEAAIHLAEHRQDTRWVWVGALDSGMERECLARLRAAKALNLVFFPGHSSDTDTFYAGSDLYALTSREDPFPSVVLEALEVGVPVVGFAGAGGFVDLAAEGVVELVPAFDATALASTIGALLADPQRLLDLGNRGPALIAERFDFDQYVSEILNLVA